MPEKRTSYQHSDLPEALIRETETMFEVGQLDKITLQELGKRLGVASSVP
nr:hypothetical protein [Thiothrix fructosivorans]